MGFFESISALLFQKESEARVEKSRINESLAVAIIFFTFIVLLFVGLYGANWLMDDSACAQFGTRTKQAVVFEFPSGCYVLHDGKWVPLRFLREEKTNGK